MGNARIAGLIVAAAVAVAGGGASAADDTHVARAHRTIRATPEAQARFDEGLAFLWAFSIGEARLRFRRAADADPACAMCRWGEALAETTDINDPRTDAGDLRASAAIADAKHRAAEAPRDERMLIDALALRFAAGTSNAAQDHAYADAMDRYVEAQPDDALGHDVAAYARWFATEHAVDAATGEPTDGAKRIERDLDRALALDPADLGAHHLRIHLEENTNRASAALADARFFDAITFAPGMSHLPHMAGHIYARLGMWDETVAANERALANDDAYVAAGSGEGWAYLRRYHGHDGDFIAYALCAQGRPDEARRVLRGAGDRIAADIALRAGDNAAVLKLATLDDAPYLVAERTIALARSGKLAEARALVARASKASPWMSMLARAAIARAAGDGPAELQALGFARALVSGAAGDPKTAWPDAPGEAYGAALLRAHRADEAERIFREETTRFPNDPRLEFGLAEALRAQQKDDAQPRAAATRSWHGARPLTLDDLA